MARLWPLPLLLLLLLLPARGARGAQLRANPIRGADPMSGESMFSQQESEFDGSSAGAACPRPPCMALRRSAAKRFVRSWQPDAQLLNQPWPPAVVPPLPTVPPTDAKDVHGVAPQPYFETKPGELVPIRWVHYCFILMYCMLCMCCVRWMLDEYGSVCISTQNMYLILAPPPSSLRVHDDRSRSFLPPQPNMANSDEAASEVTDATQEAADATDGAALAVPG